MTFLDFLHSIRDGVEIPLRIFLITMPILILGITLSRLLERRSLPTFWSSFALRHTFIVTALAIFFTLAFGPYIRPLIILPTPPPPPLVHQIETPTPPIITTLPNTRKEMSRVPLLPATSTPSFQWTRKQTMVLWVSISALLLALYTASAVVLMQVARRAQDAPEKWQERVCELCHAFGGTISPRLKQSSTVTSPLAIDLPGINPPVIVLPLASAEENSENNEALTIVLAHEIAHLARRDGQWTLAVRLLTVLFWFQPLLWVLASHMDRAAEFDCDAEALRCTTALSSNHQQRNYASSLLTYAETALQENLLIRTTAVLRIIGTNRFFSRLFLKERIERIMEKRTTDLVVPARSWRYGMTATLSLLGIASVALFGVSATTSAARPEAANTAGIAPAIAAPEAMEDEEGSGLSKRITIAFVDTPIEDAIKAALKDTGINCKLSRDMQGKNPGIVNLRVTDVPVESVLRLIIKSSTQAPYFSYRLVGKTVIIEPAALDANGLPIQKVRVNVTKKPLREVLDSLFGVTGMSYSLDYKYNDPITVDTKKEVDFPTALQEVLHAYSAIQLRYSTTPLARSEVHIAPLPRIERGEPMPPSDPISVMPISVDFNQVPLRTALEQISKLAYQNFSIGPEVSGTVTLKCSETPFQEVLQLLLKQSDKPATFYYYADENVIYITKPRP